LAGKVSKMGTFWQLKVIGQEFLAFLDSHLQPGPKPD